MEKILAQFDSFFNTIRAAFADKELEYNDRRKHIAVLLFSRILAGCDTCQLMINNGMVSHLPVVLRSIHEANIDLINTSKSENYPDVILLALAQQELKMLRYFESHKKYKMYFNDESIPLKRILAARGIISKHKEIENKTTLLSRFKLADREIEYFSLYNDLCRSSHNNIDILVHTHSDNKGRDAISHRTPDTKTMANYMHVITTLLSTSAIIFRNYLDIKDISLEESVESAKHVLDLIEATFPPTSLPQRTGR